MVHLLLVSKENDVHSCIRHATELAGSDQGSWQVVRAPSILSAIELARHRPFSSVLLFEFHVLSETLRREIETYRKLATPSPLSAVVSRRPFDPEELEELRLYRVSGFIDCGVLSDAVRTVRTLSRVASQLVTHKLRALLRSRLEREPLALALDVCSSIEALTWNASTGDSTIPKTWPQRPFSRRGSNGEVAQVAIRLIFMVLIAEARGEPVARVFSLAGFPTADDARKLLFDYSGVGASRLSLPGFRARAIEQLIAVVAGRASPRRRSELSGRYLHERSETGDSASSPKCQVRNPKSEIRNPKSEIRNHPDDHQ
jgi:hypothetical protein